MVEVSRDFEKSPRPAKAAARQARRTVNALAAMLLLSVALSYLVWFLVDRTAPFFLHAVQTLVMAVTGCSSAEALSVSEELAASPAVFEVVSMAVDVLACLLPFALFSRHILSRDFDTTFPLFGGKRLKGFLPVFACLQLMSSAMASLSESVGGFLMPELFYAFPDAGTASVSGAPELLVSFLSLCVFTPLIEEYVYRGVIYGALRPYGFGFAAVSGAMIFGLAHGGPSSFAYAVASGLVFAAVFEKTKNVRACVLLHACNNAVSFLFADLLPRFADEALILRANLIYNIFLGVTAVFGFVLLFIPEREPESRGKEDAAVRVPMSAFLSLGTVLYILLFVYNTGMLYLYGY